MISATLDSSCALNFLSTDEEPDENLMELISLALAGRVAINVSQETFEEVERTSDHQARQRRLTRLSTFGRLEISSEQVPERDVLADKLHTAIFPKAVSGSSQDDHNARDCRQLAAHHLIGRDTFVTRDERLLRGAKSAAEHGITVMSSGSSSRESALTWKRPACRAIRGSQFAMRTFSETRAIFVGSYRPSETTIPISTAG